MEGLAFITRLTSVAGTDRDIDLMEQVYACQPCRQRVLLGGHVVAILAHVLAALTMRTGIGRRKRSS
jgi:hypothetical protein